MECELCNNATYTSAYFCRGTGSYWWLCGECQHNYVDGDFFVLALYLLKRRNKVQEFNWLKEGF